jgi:hypothetical protein
MDDVSVARRTRVDRPLALCGERIKRSRSTYAEELEAVGEEEDRPGRSMTPPERDAFACGLHSPEYAAEAWLLAAEALLRARYGGGDDE